MRFFSDAQGQLVQDIVAVLLICKNEEDPNKNEGARVLTRLYIDFSHTHWQLTLRSIVKSRRNLNSSKLLLLSSLPTRMKKIQSNIKALEC